jgi:hypothetical protein
MIEEIYYLATTTQISQFQTVTQAKYIIPFAIFFYIFLIMFTSLMILFLYKLLKKKIK